MVQHGFVLECLRFQFVEIIKTLILENGELNITKFFDTRCPQT